MWLRFMVGTESQDATGQTEIVKYRVGLAAGEGGWRQAKRQRNDILQVADPTALLLLIS